MTSTAAGEPQCVALSRRSFLVASGGFAIGLSFVGVGSAQQVKAAGVPAVFKPNAWVTIDTDGIVTLMSPSAEVGQGAMTGVPLCLANELDADWSKVRVEHAPCVPAVFGNPLAHMAMTTHADYSIQGYFDKVRMIGAQTRRMLMGAAAAAWRVPLKELNTEPGRVVHAASGRSAGYGELARTAQVPDKLTELAPSDLKPREQWRLIGRTVPRVDVPGKVNGSAVYGIDVQLPGMLYAAILYPPVRHEKPVKVDDGLARAVPGVREIVVLDRGVGVIGDTVQATRAAKNALQVQWSSQSSARQYDSSQIPADYQRIANDLEQAGVTMRKKGEAPTNLAAAARTVTREFHSAHVAHATLEPPNATARVDADGVTLWLGTQSPSHVIATASHALGLKPQQVTVNTTFVGGAFGRLADDSDAALDAMLLARAVQGRPVKLIRTREDEFLNDPVRPLAVQRVDANLDEHGRILAWRHRVVASSHLGRTQPHVLDKYLHGQDVVSALYDHPYGWQDELVQYVRADRGWDVGAFRGVAMGYTNFAAESVIDEIAAQLRVDPVAYRLRLLETNARGRAVLQRVAQMAQWNQQRPRGRALGVAMARMSETIAAQVVEVSITRKREIRVHRTWIAADAGTLVNPDSVRAQFEGGTVMGLGVALHEIMAIKAGEPQALNFAGYFPPRLSQVPESIEVELLATEHPPGGVGEIGLTMVAPASAAAVARLTGKRLRSLPLQLA